MSTLSATAQTGVRRILDGAARRLLAEQLAVLAASDGGAKPT
jgi:hypothetical protein